MKIKEKRKIFIKAIFITIFFILFLFIMQKNVKATSILEENDAESFNTRSNYENLIKYNKFAIELGDFWGRELNPRVTVVGDSIIYFFSMGDYFNLKAQTVKVKVGDAPEQEIACEIVSSSREGPFQGIICEIINVYEPGGGATLYGWNVCIRGIKGDGLVTVTIPEGFFGYTYGIKKIETYEYVDHRYIDNTPPACIITTEPTTSPTNADKIKYTFTFSEEVIGFEETDINVINGTKQAGTFTKISDKEYTLMVKTEENQHNIQKVKIDKGCCEDEAENEVEEASKEIEINRVRPTCIITTEPTTSPTNETSIKYIFTFSDKVIGFEETDINIINGTKQADTFMKMSDNEYTLVVTNEDITKPIDQTASIEENVCTDLIGNINKSASKTMRIEQEDLPDPPDPPDPPNPPASSKNIIGMIITKFPETINYAKPADFNAKGLTTKVLYDDGTTKVLSYDGTTISGLETGEFKTIPGNTIYEKYGKFLEITAEYKESGQTVTNRFTVALESDITQINVKKEPNKKEYQKGEKFDPAGLEIIITDKSENKITITDPSKISIAGFDSSKTGTQTITISYAGQTTSFDITVGSNDKPINQYEIKGEYIINIEPETTIKQFISNLVTDSKIEIYDKTKKVINESDIVKTGMKLKLTKGSTTNMYKLVVNGDINGSGKISVADVTLILRHRVEKLATNPNQVKMLADEYLQAADFNKDGDVNLKDLVLIITMIVENK